MATQQQPDNRDNRENRENADVSAVTALTKAEIDALSPEQKAEIADRKARNIMAAKIAGTNWGKGMDLDTRRAVADWGLRNGVDVVTEIHVLGGNIYLNHQFYINRLLEMADRGDVLDFGHRFINVDARLDEKDPHDAEEIRLRRQLRIHHNAPEAAVAVVLFHVVFKRNPHTRIEGCKWTGGGTRKSDPVGDTFPVETAISRAARRCLKFAVASMPPRMKAWIETAEDDAALSLGEVLDADRERQKLDRAQVAELTKGGGPVPRVDDDDYTGTRQLPAGGAPDFISMRERYEVPVMRPVSTAMHAPVTRIESVPESVRESVPGDAYGLDASRAMETAERDAGAHVVAPVDSDSVSSNQNDQPATAPVSASVSAGADLFQDDTELLTDEERAEHERRKAADKRRAR